MNSCREPYLCRVELIWRIVRIAAFSALTVIVPKGVGAQEQAGNPQPASEVHYVLRFRLGVPYADLWSPDREAVGSGVLAAIAIPAVGGSAASSAQLLLFCDGGLAELLNPPAGSGVVIAILPERCFATQADTLDASVWSLLSTRLPERLLQEDVVGETRRQRSEVGDAAILRRTLSKGAIVSVDEPQFFASKKELLREAAGLIRRFAPEDEAAAVGFSVPPERTFRLPDIAQPRE